MSLLLCRLVLGNYKPEFTLKAYLLDAHLWSKWVVILFYAGLGLGTGNRVL